jgi:cyclase
VKTYPNRIALQSGARPSPGEALVGGADSGEAMEAVAAGTTRREFLGLSLLAAAGAAASPAVAAVTAGVGGGWRGQPSQSQGLQWTELRDGVWVSIGGGGNSMLAISGEEAVLVDTKLAPLGATLQREATSRAPKLAMVINTHHHADHSGGNFAFEDLRLIAHEKAAPRIRRQIDSYLQQVRGALSGAGGAGAMRDDLERVRGRIDDLGEQSWAPRETVSGDREEWTLGDMAIEARHFGAGHTDNDMVICLPGRNVLHAGDLLFQNLHPYFDPPGGATCEGWIESVRRAIQMCDDETIVIPGHGEVTGVDGLESQLRYLEKLWEEVGRLVDQGTGREQAAAMEWPFMDGLGRPEVRPRAIGAVFDERSKK